MIVESPSDIRGWIASWWQTPIARVTVAGKVVQRVTNASVDLGYDQQSAAATVSVSSPVVPTWAPGDSVVVELGFGQTHGALQRVFAGEVEDVDLSFFPHRVELRAAGYLRRLQLRYPEQIQWANIDDGDLWRDLMRRAGVPRYADDPGEDITYGTRAPVTLQPGEPPRDLVDRLDQSSPTGMKTFEVGGVVQRGPVLGIPASKAAHRYAQGDVAHSGRLPVLSLRRTDTTRNIANRVIVSGLPSGGDSETNFAERRASSPYVPRDADGNERDVTFTFSSDLLEYREQCDDLAVRYLTERNRRTDDISLRAPVNPLLMPGQTVELLSAKLAIDSPRNYFVRHVTHSYGPDGAFTEAALEGGAGESGYLVGLDPVAAFVVTITSEVVLVGGVNQRLYTCHFDGSSSYDPDGTVVRWQWSLSTGPSGEGVTFDAAFTEAQWAAGPEMTLTVTDDDDDPTGPHTNSVTEAVSGETTEILIRTLYVAASSQAEATGDGGFTWGTWAPGSGVTVRATPEIAPEGGSYFGLSDGRLLRTQDALATAPELVHTFPSSVETIWCNEADASRVWVGLANGDVWYTIDAGAGAAAVWLRAVTLDAAVNWVVESYGSPGEVRACAGSRVYVTFDAFGHTGILTTLESGVARRLALSFFGNYASGTAAVPVVTEAGEGVPFPGPAPADARITSFARQDGLLAVDDAGAAWVKGPGESAFHAVAPAGRGAAGHVVRDGDQEAVFYAACAEGLVKTFDAGASWAPLRDYAGVDLVGLQVGYAAAPMTPPFRWRYVERASNSDGDFLWNGTPLEGNGTIVGSLMTTGRGGKHDPPPAGWMDPDFDASAPWTGASGQAHAWDEAGSALVSGAAQHFWRAWDHWADEGPPVPGAGTNQMFYWLPQHALFRHTFTVPDPGPDGPWQTCLFESYGLWSDASAAPMEVFVHATALEAYINGHQVELGGGSGMLGFCYVDPAWLVADGATPNVIAVHAMSHSHSLIAGKRTAWKLTITNHPEVISLETGGDGAVYWRPTGECDAAFYAPEDDGPPAGWNGPATAGELTSPQKWRTFNASVSAHPAIEHPVIGDVAMPGVTSPVQRTTYAQATWRHPTILPDSSTGGPYRRVTLTLGLPPETSPLLAQRTVGVWLNGQMLDARTSGEHEIDPTLLRPGAWNVLCLQASAADNDTWPGWVSYVVRIEL